MRKKIIYSYEVEALIEEKIPHSILEAMRYQGWNVFGIYETVQEELKKEKKRKKLVAN